MTLLCRQGRDGLASAYRRPARDGRGDGFEGRPQPVVVRDDEDAAPRDLPCERDDPVRGSAHDLTDRSSQVDAAVAGEPVLLGWIESGDDRPRLDGAHPADGALAGRGR